MYKKFRKDMFRHKTLGQSTAEYLIILILVSISSIGIMSIFGKSVRQQLSNVVAAFTGSESNMIDAETLKKAGEDAKNRASKGVSMKGISSDEIKEY